MSELLHELQRDWPVETWRDDVVLIAVSGGADSVALLRAACQLRPAGAAGRVIAAHFNHALRPEADDDEAFVAELTQRLEIPMLVERASDELRSAAPRAGLEAAARQARYAFLHRAVARTGARYLATGHTADDQAETILHRILRGSGLHGLAGIPHRRAINDAAVLVRPLLNVDRHEILGYLGSLGQPFQVDPSNENQTFTRNRLRRHLLPLLRDEYNPQVDHALRRLGALAAEAQQAIDRQIESLWDQAVLRQGDALLVKLAVVKSQPAFIACELLRKCWQAQNWPQRGMSLLHWEQLAQQVRDDASPAAQDFPGRVRSIRRGEHLRLESC